MTASDSFAPYNGIARIKPSLTSVGAAGERFLPTGKRVAVTPTGELVRVLKVVGVNVDSSLGRQSLAEAYDKHLSEIEQRGAKQARDEWLRAAEQYV